MRAQFRPLIAIAAAFSITLLLSACNFPGATGGPGGQEDQVATQAAQTVSAELTQSDLGTQATEDPGAETTPTATPMPATDTPEPASPTPEPTTCQDAADFITDVSIPDDTRISPGNDFTKTWRLENAGTCTWTTDYDLVFDRGDRMGAPSSIPLPGTVRPGDSVDLSVSMTAPAGNGEYQGFWKLRNADNETFGIGASADVAFWVLIKVGSPAPVQVYDFDANYCDADWVSGAGALPCPGSDTDSEGFVIRINNPTFEGGRQENERALETHPEWVNNGVITGTFPLFNVQDGDVFRAVIGCRQGGNNCQVTYQLNARPDGGSLQNLAEWDETYDGSINEVEVDLSSLAGKSVRFTLAIQADGSSSQDWALWLSPRIMRQQ